MPEAPILLFWFIQKFILSKPEAIIWSLIHDRPAWQFSVDLLNSIPLILGALLLCAWIKHTWLTALFASIGLHLLCDLPFHGKEALQHLLPFNHRQFDYCISYHQSANGDPWYYFAEITVLLLGTLYLLRKKSSPTRLAAALFGAAYTISMIYAWSR